MIVELLELTGCNHLFFFAEYLPAVSETVASSVISTHLYSQHACFSEFKRTCVIFVIYHLSVFETNRSPLGYCLLIDETNASETRSGIRHMCGIIR